MFAESIIFIYKQLGERYKHYIMVTYHRKSWDVVHSATKDVNLAVLHPSCTDKW